MKRTRKHSSSSSSPVEVDLSSSDEEESQRNRQGYSQHLYLPTADIPKTTHYRKKKKQQMNKPVDDEKKEDEEEEKEVDSYSTKDPGESPDVSDLGDDSMTEISDQEENLESREESDESEKEYLAQEEWEDCSTQATTSQPKGGRKDFGDEWQDDFLFDGSPLTVMEATYKIIYGYLKHNLPKSALEYYLNIIRAMMPEDNDLPETVYSLFKYVERMTSIPNDQFVRRHYYCKKCKTYLGVESKECMSCKDPKEMSVFFEFSVEEQIKNLFQNYDLAKKIREYSPGQKDFISDITDGEEYVRINSRKDRGPYDLTGILNTDGLALKKSDRSHCWPVFLAIAELPPSLRESTIVFAGLWVDELKPTMNIFLKPIVANLKSCYETGIKWKNEEGKEETSKMVTALVIADAPARADLLNMTHYNGANGCHICEITMKAIKKTVKKLKKSVKTLEKPKTYKIYPFDPKEKPRLRTAARLKAQAKRAEEKGETIQGIFGRTVLEGLFLIDLSTAFVPEFMHSVLLGVVKMIMMLWFEKVGPWSLKKNATKINDFLMNVKPPNYFNRKPRSVLLSHFYKASEFLNWALFYSIPAIKDYLEEKYFDHWCLLVNSIFALLGDKIEKAKLPEIEKNLQSFVEKIPELYGEEYLTYNVHQLLHLVKAVREWGPLWATSAFPFENLNGLIAGYVHGPRNQGQELSNRIVISQRINQLQWRIGQKNQVQLSGFKVIGQSKEHSWSEREVFTITQEIFDFEKIKQHILIYKKVEIRRRIFTCTTGRKDTKENSYTIIARMNDNEEVYGFIRLFFQHNSKLFLLIDSFTINYSKSLFSDPHKVIGFHHLPISEQRELLIINFERVTNIIHGIQVGEYLCKPPFSHKTVY